MPTKREISKKQRLAIVNQLKVGIAKIESGNSPNPYEARPGFKKYPKVYGKKHSKAGQKHPKAGDFVLDDKGNKKRISSATGKYQFLKEWYSKTGDTLGIKQFAASQKGLFGEPKNMEDFRQNPELQEAYFEYYANKVLIDPALNISKNPLNLSIPEMASQFHFQPPATARNGITNGKLTGATNTNVSGLKYVSVFRKAVSDAGYQPITNNSIIAEKEKEANENGTPAVLDNTENAIKKDKEKIKEDLIKRDKAITENEYLTQPGAKEKARAKLYQEAVDTGVADIFDEYIDDENSANSEKLKDFKELISFTEKINIQYDKDLEGNTSIKGRAKFLAFNDDDREEFKRLNKKYKFSEDNGKSISTDLLFKEINKSYEGVTGDKLDIKNNIDIEQDLTFTIYGKIQDLTTGRGNDSGGQYYYGDVDTKGVSNISFNPRQKIDRKVFVKKTIVTPEEEDAKKKAEEDAKPKTKKEEVAVKKEEDPTNKGLTEEYYKNELTIQNALSGDEVNYTPGKKELPIDAIMGMSLGLIGNEQAKNANIPLRTEEVSQAFKSYTAEIAEKVKHGLPVEIEAQMKGLLADAYQGGLETIVRASGGNSATVLGNIGQLEQAKAKGLVGIQVADYEAKDRAFAQYGQAVQYMNDFDSRREIANHGIKYQEAKTKQIDGKALATAGFSKMMDSIKYQRENGPGSANDMYRSMLMQNMFGFDPKAPDNGKGDTIGTKSYYDVKNNSAKLKKEKTESSQARARRLNPSQKAAMDNFVSVNKNPEDMNKFMEYLETGVKVDPTKMEMGNISQAVKTGNYGLLTGTTNKEATQVEEPVVPALANTPITQGNTTLGGAHSVPPTQQPRPPEGQGGLGGVHSLPPTNNPNQGLGPIAIPKQETNTEDPTGFLNVNFNNQ